MKVFPQYQQSNVQNKRKVILNSKVYSNPKLKFKFFVLVLCFHARKTNSKTPKHYTPRVLNIIPIQDLVLIVVNLSPNTVINKQ